MSENAGARDGTGLLRDGSFRLRVAATRQDYESLVTFDGGGGDARQCCSLSGP